MSLNVISHNPNINETEVPINTQVKVTLDEGIHPNSLDYTSFSVNDAGTFTSVPGSLGVEYNASGISDTIVFTPNFTMSVNSRYNVYVYGKPSSVIGEDNTQLEETYSFGFTTGTGLLDYDGAPGIPSGESGSTPDAGTTTIYGSGTLSVSSTTPKNYQPMVETQVGSIDITFNGDITSTLSEISGYLTIEESPVLE